MTTEQAGQMIYELNNINTMLAGLNITLGSIVFILAGFSIFYVLNRSQK